MISDSSVDSLFWLPAPPADFAKRCRSILERGEEFGTRLRALANYDLDENELNRLVNVVSRARERGYSLAPMIPFRLAILSNSTTEFLAPALIASALRHGIALECAAADYGQFMQAALDPESSIHRFAPDAVLIAVDYRGYPLESPLGDSDAAEAAVQSSLGQLNAMRSAIHRHSNAVCIVQNLAPPAEVLFGSFDKVVPGALRGNLEKANARIAASIADSEDILLDVAGLAAQLGLARWHSPAHWNMAKLPFSSDYVPLYAEHVARTLAALRGKGRRCLVLDLDNTVWGGVIGDDGLEGIKLAQGDATGEAHLSVQRYSLALRERGIVLAVSSKNTDEVARKPFREHPEMLLREEHIAVFQANWNDKPTNIKAIADELSLGLDSFVFLDDNPAERAIVREYLPQVAVPELPDDPAFYVQTLSAAGYFESVAFSDEDRKRAQYYQDNARRVTLQQQMADIGSYLASLEMVITFQPFDETGRARISQLINKSNQFNLTTRRYTEAEVAELEQDPACFTLQVRLADIFGDNGMIGVIICRPAAEAGVAEAGVAEQDAWEIDTWLMSCRVLGRRVEQMVLRQILEHARRAGIRKLTGIYRPTDRNKLVVDHYAKLGFTRIGLNQTGEADSGLTRWELAVEGAEPEAAPMKIVCSGFAAAAQEPA